MESLCPANNELIELNVVPERAETGDPAESRKHALNHN